MVGLKTTVVQLPPSSLPLSPLPLSPPPPLPPSNLKVVLNTFQEILSFSPLFAFLCYLSNFPHLIQGSLTLVLEPASIYTIDALIYTECQESTVTIRSPEIGGIPYHSICSVHIPCYQLTSPVHQYYRVCYVHTCTHAHAHAHPHPHPHTHTHTHTLSLFSDQPTKVYCGWEACHLCLLG